MITVIDYSFMLGGEERKACEIQVLNGAEEVTQAIDEIREVVEYVGGRLIESAVVVRPLGEEDRKLLEEENKEQAYKWFVMMVEAYENLEEEHSFPGFIDFVNNRYKNGERNETDLS